MVDPEPGTSRPELYLRQIPHPQTEKIIEIDSGGSGVAFQARVTTPSRATVIYGQGVDDAGISYSGMEVCPDGKTTYLQTLRFRQLCGRATLTRT